MEWIILVVLVPAVIVPIVLLFGFAGCSSFGTETAPPPSPPAGPFELVAKAVSETQIDLAWKHNSMGGVKFIVSFLGPDGVWNENYATVTEKSLPSASLSPGVSYSYRVRATLGSGNDSGPSNTATTRTWKWEEFYNKPPTDNEGAFPGDCLVQRIDKALLTYSGDAMKVRLTLRGSANAANAALAIDRLSISHAASPSAANPAPQLWGFGRSGDAPAGIGPAAARQRNAGHPGADRLRGGQDAGSDRRLRYQGRQRQPHHQEDDRYRDVHRLHSERRGRGGIGQQNTRRGTASRKHGWVGDKGRRVSHRAHRSIEDVDGEAGGAECSADAPALVHIAVPVHRRHLEGGAIGPGLHDVHARVDHDLLLVGSTVERFTEYPPV